MRGRDRCGNAGGIDFDLSLGRLVALLIGLVLMIAGVALTATLVGAIVGIPLIIFGFTLAVCGLF